MISYIGNHIKMTRGNTLQLKVAIYGQDGNDYEPAEGDVVKFLMKKNYSDATFTLQKTIPNDTLLLSLSANDTKTLDVGEYVYDIKLTTASGDVDTFINGATLTLVQEVG